jgi:hypothetical protein
MSKIFKSEETYETAKSEKPTRSSQDMSETYAMASPPGMLKYPGHDVQNVVRKRRGYTTY